MSTKAKPPSHDPAPFAPDTFNPPTQADQWLGFADALDARDVETARRFLADQGLPIALAAVLSQVRPEAARLQAIIAAGVDQSKIDAAEIRRRLLEQSHPKTAEDADLIGEKLASLSVDISSMQRRRDAAANAQSDLTGLHNVFPEMIDGSPGKKACGGTFNHALHNALVASGFDAQQLTRQPWQQAYRLENNNARTPRRRLRTVK